MSYQTIRYAYDAYYGRERAIEEVLNVLNDFGHEVRVVSVILVERAITELNSETLEWLIIIYSEHVFSSEEIDVITRDSNTRDKFMTY